MKPEGNTSDFDEAEVEEYTAGIYMNEQGKKLNVPPGERGTYFLIRG